MNTQTNTLYQLAHIVLPEEKDMAYHDLFLRYDHNKLHFNTWMNTFAARKFSTYCELGNVYLTLKIQGKCRLEITGNSRCAGKPNVDHVLYSGEIQDEVCIEVPRAKEYDGLFFSIIQDLGSPVVILGGAWCTDVAPLRRNKMAIVTCTYKREDYITRNVELFNHFMRSNPELQDRLKLIVVDNGQTLPETIQSEYVELYPNMNAGGAGGFTRGLIEIRKKNEGYTRVLFMDDDVEVFTESFFRTLVMADYLLHEHRQAFINGAMLDMYDKRQFIENLALQHELWVRAYHNPCDLSYDNILRVNNIPESVFHNPDIKTDSAWWYSCFDLELVEQKGLPLPVFFRGDDLEWGWRNFGNTHISMNGICVWHAPFVFRVSKSADYYYLPRNMFMVHSIYTPSFKSWWKGIFHSYRKYLTRTYNYVGLEMFTMALQDILKGDAAFRENPSEQLKRVNAANNNSLWKDCKTPDEMQKALHPAPFKLRKGRRLLYKLTSKGQFCPPAFMKKKRNVPDWYPPVEAFAMVRTVNLYNPLRNQYEVRSFDLSKIRYYKRTICQLINQIDQRFEQLQTIFNKAHQEFSTEEFWKSYLDLKD